MRRFLFKTSLVAMGFIALSTSAAEEKTLGPWYHDGISCEITFVQRGGKWEEVWDKCKLKQVNGSKQPLRALGGNRYKEVESKGSWHYLVAASGNLEVRDSQGVVRVFNATGPKTAKQEAAALKSEGARLGMTPEEVIASSWGKPKRINRTTTAAGERQQWVYSGGYLYFTNGVLTAVQN